MKRVLLRTFISSIVWLAPVSVDAQTLAASFTRIQQGLDQAAVAKPAQEPVLTKIAQDAFALQVASARISPADAPEYARSLLFNAYLIEVAKNSTDEQAAPILADVSEDLHTKRQAAAAMGAASTFPGRVRVRVSTIHNGRPLGGYVVTLSPKRWTGPDPMYRLPALSPASGEVAPGRYVVSALRDNAVQASDTFQIGLAAEDEIEIQLPVP